MFLSRFVRVLLIGKPGDQTRVARYEMRFVVRKPAFCICENKDADQLRGNRKADQRLCFRYTDSAIPLAIFCSCTAWFVSDLVGNLEDRFSQDEAHMVEATLSKGYNGFSGHFPYIFEINFCYFVVPMNDLMHDVETKHGLC